MLPGPVSPHSLLEEAQRPLPGGQAPLGRAGFWRAQPALRGEMPGETAFDGTRLSQATLPPEEPGLRRG